MEESTELKQFIVKTHALMERVAMFWYSLHLFDELSIRLPLTIPRKESLPTYVDILHALQADELTFNHGFGIKINNTLWTVEVEASWKTRLLTLHYQSWDDGMQKRFFCVFKNTSTEAVSQLDFSRMFGMQNLEPQVV